MVRKLGFALLLVIFAATFVRLGIWQLDRAHLVQEISKPVADQVEVGIETLIKPRISIPDNAKGRLVTATGRYERILKAPNQSTENDGVREKWQVGILKLSNGAGLLVVRGVGDVAPPSELIEVHGRLMPSQIEDRAVGANLISELSRLDSTVLLSRVNFDLYDGYLIAITEKPDSLIERVPAPQLVVKAGGFYWQHISYVVIWWLMALLVLCMPLFKRRSEESIPMNGAYIRFRIMAWVAGIMSLILWFVDIPVKYFLTVPLLEDKIDWIPIVHGYQYPFYIITVMELSYRLKWNVIKIVKFILAGTLPVASFLAEKKVRAIYNSGK
jgi:integral membrane protein